MLQKNAESLHYLRKSAISAGTLVRHFALDYYKGGAIRSIIENQIKKHGIYCGNCREAERRKEYFL